MFLVICKNDFSSSIVQYMAKYFNLFDWKSDLEELLTDSIKLLDPSISKLPEVDFITSGPLSSGREVSPMNFFTGLLLMGYYIVNVTDLDLVCDPKTNKYYTWTDNGLCEWRDLGESLTTVTVQDSQRLSLPLKVQTFMNSLMTFRKQLETEILSEKDQVSHE